MTAAMEPTTNAKQAGAAYRLSGCSRWRIVLTK